MSDTTLFNVGTATDTETVRATITRIRFEKDGFVIAQVQPDLSHPSSRDGEGKRRRLDTIKGAMVEPMVGQLYEFSGVVSFNDQYKTREMKLESYRTILPTDRDGIASYLIDVAKWIGPSTAQAILKAFGDQTLAVLKDEPERVTAMGIKGLTAERVQEMSQSLKDNADMEAAAVEVNQLLGGSLGPATVRKAIRVWRSNAAILIKRNPFILTELHGVGFISADAVFKKLGGDAQDLRRHQAALCHILGEASQQHGHTFMRAEQVEIEGKRLIGGLRPDVFDACEHDESAECDGVCVSLGTLAKAEQYVAGMISALLAGKSDESHLYPVVDKAGLASDQAAAVDAFQSAAAFILCGAPGTGKTYTVARIVRTLRDSGLAVLLAAPTGKAAKQMSLALSQVCGNTHASTIHSLLEPTVDEETGRFTFAHGELLPLDADVIVIDEFSMVDILLCQSLLKAIPLTSRLLIVGDHYQLPSVGPGAVLRDMIAAGVPSYELREIKRNAGSVVKACHAIKDGRLPVPDQKLELDRPDPLNWRHIDQGGPDEIKAAIAKIISEKIKPLGINPVWGLQLISPVNEKGPLSCDALNELAKGLLNDIPPEEKLGFSVGDKVVRLKNGQAQGYFLPDADEAAVSTSSGTGGRTDWSREPVDEAIRIVNGDLGVVTAVYLKEIVVQLMYPPRVVRINRREHHLKLAYCMTCHKLQGSECDVVVMPLHMSLAKLPMVTREWLYTALSRAKRFILTVGDLGAMGPMVRKIGNVQRQTLLGVLLKQRLAGLVATKSELDDL